MGLRNSGFRILLLFIITFLAWYTFQLYAELIGRLVKTDISPTLLMPIKPDLPQETKNDVVDVNDPDDLIDQKKLKEADEQWEKEQSLIQPNIKFNRSPCSKTATCKNDEMDFKILTGAANVIGPSICFNSTIIMKNSVNNVDRGMNIAMVNGITGKSIKTAVFDLYGKDSTELKAFLSQLGDEHVVMITTYDDAAFKLDDEAKDMLTKLGSKHAKGLSFRDNWIFVGGKKQIAFEQYMKNDKDKNKYGDWPEAIVLEGCLPILK